MPLENLIIQYLIIIGVSIIMLMGMYLIKKRATVNGVGVKIQNQDVRAVLFIGALLIFFLLYSSFRVIYFSDKDGYITGGGSDALVYKEIFLYMDDSLIVTLRTVEQEPLWLIWNYIIRRVTDRFEIFLLSFYFIEFVLQYRICIHLASKRYFAFCYLTIIVNLLFVSLCIMRATLCIFIIGNAMIDIKNKHNLRAFLVGIISTGIHYSSLIFFPSFVIYLFYNSIKNRSAFFYLLMCVIMAFSGVALGGAISIILTGTRYSVVNDGYAWGLLCERIVILVAILRKYRQFDFRDRKTMIALSFYAANFMVFGFQLYMTMVYRMYLFANIAELILLPSLLDFYKEGAKSSTLDLMFYLGLIAMYLLQFVQFYYEDVYTYGLLTYHTILW